MAVENLEKMIEVIEFRMEDEKPELKEKFEEIKEKLKKEAELVDVNHLEYELIKDLKSTAKKAVENVRAALAVRRAVERLDERGEIEDGLATYVGAEAEEIVMRNLKFAGEEYSAAEVLEKMGLMLHGGKVNYLHVIAVPLCMIIALKLLRR